MALEFIRQNPINDIIGDSEETQKKRDRKKLPKGKFSVLLGGNLLVWVFFIVSILDLKVFSMNSVPGIPVKLPQTMAVTGIIYSETSPHAIISKEAYGVGDVVNGWKIVNISRTEVQFEKNGKTLSRQVR